MQKFVYTFKAEKILCFFLIVAIVATTVFIFSNSLKSKEESTNESLGITNSLKPIIDPENKIPIDTLEYFVRKYAHFLEFMLLGFELFALIFLLCKGRLENMKPAEYSLILLISAIIALCDETIQISTKRGSSVKDVWIDLSGALAGMITCFLILFFISIIRRKFKRQVKS